MKTRSFMKLERLQEDSYSIMGWVEELMMKHESLLFIVAEQEYGRGYTDGYKAARAKKGTK